ncbi:MAG: DUF982 domain-containing protein, partial [Mesorhizobium sp.]
GLRRGPRRYAPKAGNGWSAALPYRNATVVKTIADAAKALEPPWPYMGRQGRLKAIRLIQECMAGHCSQQAAFDAFKAAAMGQGLLR